MQPWIEAVNKALNVGGLDHRQVTWIVEVLNRQILCCLQHPKLQQIFIYSLFFVSEPCARLSWPSRQLLSARKSTVSYRIVSITALHQPHNLYLIIRLSRCHIVEFIWSGRGLGRTDGRVVTWRSTAARQHNGGVRGRGRVAGGAGTSHPIAERHDGLFLLYGHANLWFKCISREFHYQFIFCLKGFLFSNYSMLGNVSQQKTSRRIKAVILILHFWRSLPKTKKSTGLNDSLDDMPHSHAVNWIQPAPTAVNNFLSQFSCLLDVNRIDNFTTSWQWCIMSSLLAYT